MDDIGSLLWQLTSHPKSQITQELAGSRQNLAEWEWALSASNNGSVCMRYQILADF